MCELGAWDQDNRLCPLRVSIGVQKAVILVQNKDHHLSTLEIPLMDFVCSGISRVKLASREVNEMDKLEALSNKVNSINNQWSGTYFTSLLEGAVKNRMFTKFCLSLLEHSFPGVLVADYITALIPWRVVWRSIQYIQSWTIKNLATPPPRWELNRHSIFLKGCWRKLPYLLKI